MTYTSTAYSSGFRAARNLSMWTSKPSVSSWGLKLSPIDNPRRIFISDFGEALRYAEHPRNSLDLLNHLQYQLPKSGALPEPFQKHYNPKALSAGSPRNVSKTHPTGLWQTMCVIQLEQDGVDLELDNCDAQPIHWEVCKDPQRCWRHHSFSEVHSWHTQI